MKITADGQITIPAHVRERLGLTPDTELELGVEGDAVYIRRAATDSDGAHREPGAPYPGKGEALVARLWGKATTSMTTYEIMRLTRGDG